MRRFLDFFGIMAFVATACGAGPSTTGGEQASASVSEQPVPGGRIVLGATGDPKTMQLLISADTQFSLIWNQFYPTLTRTNSKTGITEGSLAEKFELSS